MNKEDAKVILPPIAVVGGVANSREEFAELFQDRSFLDLIEYPTGLASRLTPGKQPQIVVFLYPYSREMLRQSAAKELICFVYEPYQPAVEYEELPLVKRTFAGPLDVGPFLTIGTFAQDTKDYYRFTQNRK